MSFTTAIIIIIVVVIIFSWVMRNHLPESLKNGARKVAASAQYQYDKYITDPDKLYEKTIGYEFDDTAELALKKSLKKEAMYTHNEQDGTVAAKGTAEAAITNSFVLGNLYNFNTTHDIDSKRKAAHYFNKTVSRILTNPIAAATLPTADAVIDRVQDFYDNIVDQVNHGDTTNMAFVNAAPNINYARGTLRMAKVAVATKEGAKNTILPIKAAAIEQYYQPKPVPNDPQNVHDSQLNNEMKIMFDRIRDKNAKEYGGGTADDKTVIGNIEAFIRKKATRNLPAGGGLSDHDRALRILDRMKSGGEIMSLASNEKQLLVETWRRAESAENKERVDDLKAAIVQGLADGLESRIPGKWSEVCVTGRCGRVLGAFTLLDKDSEIATPMKTQAVLRKEINERSYRIIQDYLAGAAKDTPDLVDQYNGTKPVTAEADVEALTGHIKEAIDTNLRNEYSHVSPRILNPLIDDAKEGV